MKRPEITPSALLLMLCVLRLVLPFLLQHPYYQPHRDEYLYLDYANHLAWGYMETPPLLSGFSKIIQWLGGGKFWVKFIPELVGTLTLWVAGKISLALGGGRLSIWLLFCGFVFGAFLRLFHLFQPGFLEVFSWTLMVYTLVKYHLSKQANWLLAFGLVCALGMLAKYTTAFFITALLVGHLLAGQGAIFRQKAFWQGAGLGLLLLLPNLIWQFQHRFPIAAHMQELRQSQLVNISPTDFLASQLFMLLPVAFIWLTGFWFCAFTVKGKPWRWVAWSYVLLLLILLLGSGKGYYALGIYPTLLALGALRIGTWLTPKANWLRLTIGALPLIFGAYFLPLGLPPYEPQKMAAFYEKYGYTRLPFFTWEDQQRHPLPQDFADMMGWQEMTTMIARNWHLLPDSVRQHTLIYCRGYYTAGAINFYGPAMGLPTAMSDQGSYLWWMPDHYHFKHLILIGHKKPDPDDEVFTHFASYEVLDSIQQPLFRENGIKMHLFKDADTSMVKWVEKSIREQKARFTR